MLQLTKPNDPFNDLRKTMRTQVQRIKSYLNDAFGRGVEVDMSEPFEGDGVWFLDVFANSGEKYLLIECSPKYGYKLTLELDKTLEHVEFYPDSTLAGKRAAELICQPSGA